LIMARTNFTTPVGRLVLGDLYKPQTTDAEGKPLVCKSGPNIGQSKVVYFFAVAIPKNVGETHWANSPWGAIIWKVGHDAFNAVADSPVFAWKIVDGDSPIPNRAGKKPCEREGYPGNWVVSFSSGFAPKIYNRDGSSPIVEPGAVKLGYYVQVNGDVDGNGSQQQPGVYINHSMVALSAYGPEIFVGPDVASVGFGTAPLPPGAMAQPPEAFTPPVAGPPVSQPPVSQPPVAGPPLPNPAILNGPPPGLTPDQRLTALAQGATYDALLAKGWNDTLLIQHGLMTA
jgi:hypothetical protein